MSTYCADHGWESDEARIACLDRHNDELIREIATLIRERDEARERAEVLRRALVDLDLDETDYEDAHSRRGGIKRLREEIAAALKGEQL